MQTKINSEQAWHSLNAEEVFRSMHLTDKGLSDAEVQERRNHFGKNTLPTGQKVTLFKIVLNQLINPLIFILIAAAFASVLIGEGKDAVFIFLVILLNAIIGSYQEYNAEKSASSLQKMLKIKAQVIRNGKVETVDSEELVPGDLVKLESGVKIPADLRLIEVNNLEIDESFLTGESVAVNKKTDALPENTLLADKKNMAFAGSTVLIGRGLGVVIAIGGKTQVGQIAENVNVGSSAKPPLIQRMEHFTKQISIFIIALSVVLAVLLRWQGMDAAGIFFFVVALAVSAIPEGLPVSLTVALSIATRRMARKNVIVRKLTSVESLGSCNVIASDKTGTLTVNEQTAKKIILSNGVSYSISGEGYNGKGEINCDGEKSSSSLLDDLITVSVMANEAQLEENNGVWSYSGDAMDVALLGMTLKSKKTIDEVKKEHRLSKLIPYESEKKFSGAFYTKEGKNYVAVKGAAETILAFCSHSFDKKMDSQEVDNLLNQANSLASKGYRVLAFAKGEITAPFDEEDLSKTPLLQFLGFVCFIDPLRAEAKQAVEKCKNAGIEVLMITGDHPATAENIAKELGILGENEKAVTGVDLKNAGNMESPEFEKLVQSTHVFARVSPVQKLEIVDVHIRNGAFVAVTGDGVNDAPALKRANIGVAMGSGTDVAKEVGAMIVVDDNFSSIVSGVEEGRYAYDNVRKVIYLLVSTGAAEVIMFLLAIFAGLPLPLLAVQLLWLNLVTNGIQDKALAFESGEPQTMSKPPRKPSEGIFNQRMVEQILLSGLIIGGIAFGLWYYLIHVIEMNEFHARNMVLLLMVLMQNIHIFNCRSEYTSTFKIPISKNYFLIGFVIFAQIFHIACMHIPFMQSILRVEPITLQEWLQVLSMTIPVLLVMEMYKWIKRKSETTKTNLK